MPSKGFQSLGETLRYSELSHPKRGSATSSPAKNNGDLERKQTRSASRSRDRWVLRDREGRREIYRGKYCRSDQSNMSLDSSLTLLDDTVNSASGVWNRSSLLEALRSEKESRPESYWRV